MKEFRPEGAHYEIIRRVGEGLSAEVYKACRVDSRGFSRQNVALKVLKTQNAVPILRREFESLARVSSPHCVRVLAWENNDEQCALALEWIEGATLYEIARTYRLEAEICNEIIGQIQTGLADLANAALIHGDLHPRNVLIDESGVVRLVDFGTQALRDSVTHGAPPYLAPEIWTGEPCSIAADYFALGLIQNDLQNGTFPRDLSLEASQARAIMAIDAANPLLQRDPGLRTPLDLQSNSESKERLAVLVRRFKTLSELSKTPTAILPLPGTQPVSAANSKNNQLETSSAFIHKLIASFGFVTLAFASAVAVPVRAQAPSPVEYGRDRETTAVISVGSQRWMKLTLNGREIGYAPVTVRNLGAGPHRLSWSGPDGDHQIKLTLASGENLRLSEDTLNSLRGVRNR